MEGVLFKAQSVVCRFNEKAISLSDNGTTEIEEMQKKIVGSCYRTNWYVSCQ